MQQEPTYVDIAYRAWNSAQEAVADAWNFSYNWINNNIITPCLYDHKKAYIIMQRSQIMHATICTIISEIEKLDENISKDHTIRTKLEKLKKDTVNLQIDIEAFYKKIRRKYTRKSKAIFKHEIELKDFEERLEKNSKKVKKINFI
jgi:hypothetical protein